MTAAVQHWTCPIPAWTPPLDPDVLRTMLARFRRWEPFDGGALLDDVGAVLDDCIPAEEDVEELAERLRGHLMQLVNIAVAAEEERDAEAARLVERGRTLRAEDLPGSHWLAVGHLRRMAWTVNELLERLVATRCLREAA
ncbi:DUF6415 family natural product biosynthesis protein [Streptomyces sp. JNUCC 63]